MPSILKQKLVYESTFKGMEIRPIMDMQHVAENDSVFGTWASHLLLEEMQKKGEEKDEPQIIAEAQKGEGQQQEEQTYKLTYYNPELRKAEVLESQKAVKVPDIAQQMIEESMGLKSTYTLYRYVASPLCKTETVPWKLEEILSNREYGTPPDMGGAGVVRVAPQKEMAKAAFVAKEGSVRNAIIEVVLRKEKTEKKLEEEIEALEYVADAIKKGQSIKDAIDRLPPLTRARFLAVIQKMKLERSVVLQLLLKDVAFLRAVKKKLKKFSVNELLQLIKTMGRLQQKE